MYWLCTFTSVLGLAASGVGAGPSVQHINSDRRVRMAKRAASLETEAYTPKYLNAKTKPFAVNGSGIPEVNFDIGESYAGLLPVDHTGKELYFWYVPTTNPAASHEITIWLNGGPGCSSLDGFLHENGPVIWQAGTYLPVRNTYAWSNLTNIVWVEQPVSTGFSQGKPNATNEIDVATQFRGFWKNFVDTFDLHNRKVYITGESYAGMYVPYIADGFLNQTDTTYFDCKGILIYDPTIGHDSITREVPTLSFVEYNGNVFPFNDTFRTQLEAASQSCGYDDYIRNGLTFPPPQAGSGLGPEPGVDASGEVRPGCDVHAMVEDAIFEINPCFDVYQVGQLCPILWDVLGFPYSDFYLPDGFTQPYFNRSDVKRAINAPQNVDWTICGGDPFPRQAGDTSLKSGLNGGPLGRVTEKTNNTIVGHGALDMILLLNGTLLTLNNLTWNGARGFTAPPTKPFYVPYHFDPLLGSAAGAGIFGGWTSARGMTFVTVAASGHEVPEYQPSAGYRHLELLLGRIKSLSERSAFTTQKGYPQPGGGLGRGTVPVKEL